MPRVLGVDILGNKKLPYALRYIYGLGSTRAVQVVNAAGLDPDRRAQSLTEAEISQVAEAVHRLGYAVEGDLRREIAGNMKRLLAIHCYRGHRHRTGLPVRGQRTRCNARTRKGKRKTVGIIRKEK